MEITIFMAAGLILFGIWVKAKYTVVDATCSAHRQRRRELFDYNLNCEYRYKGRFYENTAVGYLFFREPKDGTARKIYVKRDDPDKIILQRSIWQMAGCIVLFLHIFITTELDCIIGLFS